MATESDIGETILSKEKCLYPRELLQPPQTVVYLEKSGTAEVASNVNIETVNSSFVGDAGVTAGESFSGSPSIAKVPDQDTSKKQETYQTRDISYQAEEYILEEKEIQEEENFESAKVKVTKDCQVVEEIIEKAAVEKIEEQYLVVVIDETSKEEIVVQHVEAYITDSVEENLVRVTKEYHVVEEITEKAAVDDTGHQSSDAISLKVEEIEEQYLEVVKEETSKEEMVVQHVEACINDPVEEKQMKIEKETTAPQRDDKGRIEDKDAELQASNSTLEESTSLGNSSTPETSMEIQINNQESSLLVEDVKDKLEIPTVTLTDRSSTEEEASDVVGKEESRDATDLSHETNDIISSIDQIQEANQNEISSESKTRELSLQEEATTEISKMVTETFPENNVKESPQETMTEVIGIESEADTCGGDKIIEEAIAEGKIDSLVQHDGKKYIDEETIISDASVLNERFEDRVSVEAGEENITQAVTTLQSNQEESGKDENLSSVEQDHKIETAQTTFETHLLEPEIIHVESKEQGQHSKSEPQGQLHEASESRYDTTQNEVDSQACKSTENTAKGVATIELHTKTSDNDIEKSENLQSLGTQDQPEIKDGEITGLETISSAEQKFQEDLPESGAAKEDEVEKTITSKDQVTNEEAIHDETNLSSEAINETVDSYQQIGKEDDVSNVEDTEEQIMEGTVTSKISVEEVEEASIKNFEHDEIQVENPSSREEKCLNPGELLQPPQTVVYLEKSGIAEVASNVDIETVDSSFDGDAGVTAGESFSGSPSIAKVPDQETNTKQESYQTGEISYQAEKTIPGEKEIQEEANFESAKVKVTKDCQVVEEIIEKAAVGDTGHQSSNAISLKMEKIEEQYLEVVIKETSKEEVVVQHVEAYSNGSAEENQMKIEKETAAPHTVEKGRIEDNDNSTLEESTSLGNSSTPETSMEIQINNQESSLLVEDVKDKLEIPTVTLTDRSSTEEEASDVVGKEESRDATDLSHETNDIISSIDQIQETNQNEISSESKTKELSLQEEATTEISKMVTETSPENNVKESPQETMTAAIGIKSEADTCGGDKIIEEAIAEGKIDSLVQHDGQKMIDEETIISDASVLNERFEYRDSVEAGEENITQAVTALQINQEESGNNEDLSSEERDHKIETAETKFDNINSGETHLLEQEIILVESKELGQDSNLEPQGQLHEASENSYDKLHNEQACESTENTANGVAKIEQNTKTNDDDIEKSEKLHSSGSQDQPKVKDGEISIKEDKHEMEEASHSEKYKSVITVAGDDSTECQADESGLETISSADQNFQKESLLESVVAKKDEDEKTSTFKDKVTNEEAIHVDGTSISSEVVNEEKVETYQQIGKEADVSKVEDTKEQIMEGIIASNITVEAVEEASVKNFEHGESKVDNSSTRELSPEPESSGTVDSTGSEEKGGDNVIISEESSAEISMANDKEIHTNLPQAEMGQGIKYLEQKMEENEDKEHTVQPVNVLSEDTDAGSSQSEANKVHESVKYPQKDKREAETEKQDSSTIGNYIGNTLKEAVEEDPIVPQKNESCIGMSSAEITQESSAEATRENISSETPKHAECPTETPPTLPVDATPSNESFETIPCATEDMAIANQEEKSDNKYIQEASIDSDDTRDEILKEEQNLSSRELNEKIIEITEGETLGKKVDESNEANPSVKELGEAATSETHEKFHEAHGGRDEVKNEETKSQAHKATENTDSEHLLAKEAENTETSESEIEKFEKVNEPESKNEMENKDAQKSVEDNIGNKEESSKEDIQNLATSDGTGRYSEEVFNHEKVERNFQVEETSTTSESEESIVDKEITRVDEIDDKDNVKESCTQLSSGEPGKETAQSSEQAEQEADKTTGENTEQNIILQKSVEEESFQNFQSNEKSSEKPSTRQTIEESETAKTVTSIVEESDTGKTLLKDNIEQAPHEISLKEEAEALDQIDIGKVKETTLSLQENKGRDEGREKEDALLLKVIEDTQKIFQNDGIGPESIAEALTHDISTVMETGESRKENEDDGTNKTSSISLQLETVDQNSANNFENDNREEKSNTEILNAYDASESGEKIVHDANQCDATPNATIPSSLVRGEFEDKAIPEESSPEEVRDEGSSTFPLDEQSKEIVKHTSEPVQLSLEMNQNEESPSSSLQASTEEAKHTLADEPQEKREWSLNNAEETAVRPQDGEGDAETAQQEDAVNESISPEHVVQDLIKRSKNDGDASEKSDTEVERIEPEEDAESQHCEDKNIAKEASEYEKKEESSSTNRSEDSDKGINMMEENNKEGALATSKTNNYSSHEMASNEGSLSSSAEASLEREEAAPVCENITPVEGSNEKDDDKDSHTGLIEVNETNLNLQENEERDEGREKDVPSEGEEDTQQLFRHDDIRLETTAEVLTQDHSTVIETSERPKETEERDAEPGKEDGPNKNSSRSLQEETVDQNSANDFENDNRAEKSNTEILKASEASERGEEIVNEENEHDATPNATTPSSSVKEESLQFEDRVIPEEPSPEEKRDEGSSTISLEEQIKEIVKPMQLSLEMNQNEEGISSSLQASAEDAKITLQDEPQEKKEQSLNSAEETAVRPQDGEGDAETTQQEDLVNESLSLEHVAQDLIKKSKNDGDASEKSDTEILEQPKAEENVENITHETDENNIPNAITPTAPEDDAKSLDCEDKAIAVESSAEDKKEELSSVKKGVENDNIILIEANNTDGDQETYKEGDSSLHEMMQDEGSLNSSTRAAVVREEVTLRSDNPTLAEPATKTDEDIENNIGLRDGEEIFQDIAIDPAENFKNDAGDSNKKSHELPQGEESVGNITDETKQNDGSSATNPVESNQQIDKEADVSTVEGTNEQIMEVTATANISVEAVEEASVKNFENDENNVDNPSNREMLLEPKTSGTADSTDNEEKGSDDIPNLTPQNTLIKEQEILQSEKLIISEDSSAKSSTTSDKEILTNLPQAETGEGVTYLEQTLEENKDKEHTVQPVIFLSEDTDAGLSSSDANMVQESVKHPHKDGSVAESEKQDSITVGNHTGNTLQGAVDEDPVVPQRNESCIDKSSAVITQESTAEVTRENISSDTPQHAECPIETIPTLTADAADATASNERFETISSATDDITTENQEEESDKKCIQEASIDADDVRDEIPNEEQNLLSKEPNEKIVDIREGDTLGKKVNESNEANPSEKEPGEVASSETHETDGDEVKSEETNFQAQKATENRDSEYLSAKEAENTETSEADIEKFEKAHDPESKNEMENKDGQMSVEDNTGNKEESSKEDIQNLATSDDNTKYQTDESGLETISSAEQNFQEGSLPESATAKKAEVEKTSTSKDQVINEEAIHDGTNLSSEVNNEDTVESCQQTNKETGVSEVEDTKEQITEGTITSNISVEAIEDASVQNFKNDENRVENSSSRELLLEPETSESVDSTGSEEKGSDDLIISEQSSAEISLENDKEIHTNLPQPELGEGVKYLEQTLEENEDKDHTVQPINILSEDTDAGLSQSDSNTAQESVEHPQKDEKQDNITVGNCIGNTLEEAVDKDPVVPQRNESCIDKSSAEITQEPTAEATLLNISGETPQHAECPIESIPTLPADATASNESFETVPCPTKDIVTENQEEKSDKKYLQEASIDSDDMKEEIPKEEQQNLSSKELNEKIVEITEGEILGKKVNESNEANPLEKVPREVAASETRETNGGDEMKNEETDFQACKATENTDSEHLAAKEAENTETSEAEIEKFEKVREPESENEMENKEETSNEDIQNLATSDETGQYSEEVFNREKVEKKFQAEETSTTSEGEETIIDKEITRVDEVNDKESIKESSTQPLSGVSNKETAESSEQAEQEADKATGQHTIVLQRSIEEESFENFQSNEKSNDKPSTRQLENQKTELMVQIEDREKRLEELEKAYKHVEVQFQELVINSKLEADRLGAEKERILAENEDLKRNLEASQNIEAELKLVFEGISKEKDTLLEEKETAIRRVEEGEKLTADLQIVANQLQEEKVALEEELESYRAQVYSMKQQLETTEQQSGDLSRSLAAIQEEKQSLVSTIADLNQRLEEENNEKQSLLMEKDSALREIEELEKSLEELEEAYEHVEVQFQEHVHNLKSEAERLDAEKERILAENEDLKRNLDASRNIEAELKQVFEGITKEKDILLEEKEAVIRRVEEREKLTADLQIVANQLREEKVALEEELESYRAQVYSIKQQLETTEQQSGDLNRSLAAIQEEKQSLVSTIADLNQRVEEENIVKQSLLMEKNGALGKIEELEKRLEELEEAYKHEEVQLRELVLNSKSEAERLDAEKERILAENEDLKRDLDASRNIEAELKLVFEGISKEKDILLEEKETALRRVEEEEKLNADLQIVANQLREEKVALEEELESCRAQFSSMKQQLETTEQQSGDLSRSLAAIQEDNQSLVSTIADLKQRVEEENNEKQSLLMEKDSALRKIEELEKSLEELAEAYKHVEVQFQELVLNSKLEAERLDAEKERILAENEDLKRNLDASRNIEAELKLVFEGISKEKDNLLEEKETAIRRVEEGEKLTADLQIVANQLREEKVALEEELESYRAQVYSIKQQLETTEQQSGDLSRSLAAIQEEKQSLVSTIADLNQRVEEENIVKQSLLMEKNGALGKIEELEKRLEELEEAYKHEEVQLRELVLNSKSEAERLDAEKERILAENEDLKRNLDASRNIEAELKQVFEGITKEKDILLEEKETAIRRVEEGEKLTAELQIVANQMREEKVALEEELESYRAQVSSMKQQQETTELQLGDLSQSLAAIQKENLSLVSTIADLNQRVEEENNEKQSLLMEKDSALRKIEDREKRLDELEEAYKQVEVQFQKLVLNSKSEAERLDAEKEIILAENKVLKRHLDAFLNIEAEMKQVFEGISKEKEILLEEKETAIRRVEEGEKLTAELQIVANQMREENVALEEELESYRAQVSSMKQQLETTEQQLGDLSPSLAAMQEENQSLVSTIADLNQRVEEENNEKQSLQIEKDSALRKIGKLEKTIEDSRTLADRLQDEKATLERKLEALVGELSNTKQQLESAQQKVSELASLTLKGFEESETAETVTSIATEGAHTEVTNEQIMEVKTNAKSSHATIAEDVAKESQVGNQLVTEETLEAKILEKETENKEELTVENSQKERIAVKEPTASKEETKAEKQTSKTDKAKSDEEDENEDGGDETKKNDSGSDGAVIVESSRDMAIKSPNKKLPDILSEVGSKVKQSIKKVKKAITGKTSKGSSSRRNDLRFSDAEYSSRRNELRFSDAEYSSRRNDLRFSDAESSS